MDERNRRAVIVVTSIASFLLPFMSGATNVAVPELGTEFGAGAAALNWVVTGFIVVSAMVLLPFGRLADLLGRTRLLRWGLVSFSAASVLCAAAPSLGLLIAARAVQGVGAAMLAATSSAILIAAFPPAERGRVLGINTAAVYAGLAAGPVLGGLLTDTAGWRAIFLLALLVAEAAYALCRGRLGQDPPAAPEERFDGGGALLCALAVGPLTIGLSLWQAWTPGPWLAAAGLAALAGFVFHEARTTQPLLDVRMFRRNRLFAFSNLAALIHYAATFASSFLLSLYLQVARGLDARETGAVLLVTPVVQALLSPWAGRLSDRVASRVVASSGMALCALALGTLALLDAGTSFAVLLPEIALLGAGLALFSSPNTNAVMSAVDQRLYGVAAATLGTMRQVGMTLSMAAVALVLTARLGERPVTPDVAAPFVGAMRVCFAGFAALCVLGVPASLARGPAAPTTTTTTTTTTPTTTNRT